MGIFRLPEEESETVFNLNCMDYCKYPHFACLSVSPFSQQLLNFFDCHCSCFSSPIKRGWNFAELIWADREGPLIPLDSLREAHLGWLQGMKQGGSSICLLHLMTDTRSIVSTSFLNTNV